MKKYWKILKDNSHKVFTIVPDTVNVQEMLTIIIFIKWLNSLKKYLDVTNHPQGRRHINTF